MSIVFLYMSLFTSFKVVKVWDFESGKPVFEFGNAHGDSSITCLTFDFSGRRYILRVSVCKEGCGIFHKLLKK